MITGDIGATGQYLKRKLGAGMLIGGVVHYVLKDAADRGRLGASTFRQLNLAGATMGVDRGEGKGRRLLTMQPMWKGCGAQANAFVHNSWTWVRRV